LALTAAGNYTVDWGDGTVENFSSGATAQRLYDFNAAALANTNAPVTLQGGADTVTRTSHGYINGDTVRFYNIVTTTGISANTPYFVIDSTANTFKVSLTFGGSAINLVDDGSATLLPYKQAIVQVYPQAGQNLTSLAFNVKHSDIGSTFFISSFLDIAVSGASLTTFILGTLASGSTTVGFPFLEQANIVHTDCRQLSSLFSACVALQSIVGIGSSAAPATSMPVTFTDATETVNATAHGFRNGDTVFFTSVTTTTGIITNLRYYVVDATADTFRIALSSTASAMGFTNNGSGVAVRGTDMSSMFIGCRSLQAVPQFNMSCVANATSMFQNCRDMQSVPLFNTAAVTNMSSMFAFCTALQVVPLFNTAAVTNIGGMFLNCFSLQSVPLFNTAAVTDMSNMFQNCTALQSVPLFNTAAVTNMSVMFGGAGSLQVVPLFNTAAVTSMVNMFQNCTSLQVVPLLNTAAVTNMAGMFNGCSALQSVPLFNTAAVTSMSSMFAACSALQTVPLFNTAAVTNMAAMFQNCNALQSAPAFVTTAVVSATNFINMFQNCNNLSRMQARDFRFSFSVASCKLSATALNEVYTNLPTVSGQTISVTGNPGTTADNPAIATAKGWAVTG
jgi:surface protein